MKLTEIVKMLNATEHFVPDEFDVDIQYAGTSDLMSDVLAVFSELPPEISERRVLITGLVNQQSIRTAGITDIPLVIFTCGREPNEALIEAAKAADVALISTSLTSYTVCGLMYNKGLSGIDDYIRTG